MHIHWCMYVFKIHALVLSCSSDFLTFIQICTLHMQVQGWDPSPDRDTHESLVKPVGRSPRKQVADFSHSLLLSLFFVTLVAVTCSCAEDWYGVFIDGPGLPGRVSPPSKLCPSSCWPDKKPVWGNLGSRGYVQQTQAAGALTAADRRGIGDRRAPDPRR